MLSIGKKHGPNKWHFCCVGSGFFGPLIGIAFPLWQRFCGLSLVWISWGTLEPRSTIEVYRDWCIVHPYSRVTGRGKQCSLLNFSLIKKCKTSRWPYFLILRGPYFLICFRTSNGEWAFPAFPTDLIQNKRMWALQEQQRQSSWFSVYNLIQGELD